MLTTFFFELFYGWENKLLIKVAVDNWKTLIANIAKVYFIHCTLNIQGLEYSYLG